MKEIIFAILIGCAVTTAAGCAEKSQTSPVYTGTGQIPEIPAPDGAIPSVEETGDASDGETEKPDVMEPVDVPETATPEEPNDTQTENPEGDVPDSGISSPDADGGMEVPDTEEGDSDTLADAEPADASESPDTQPVPEPAVRFLAFGDQGEGNEAQYAVGASAVTVCAERGCDFALLLGDNFYDTGVGSVDDPQLQTKFELPYAGLDMPFYVVLGNHDYGTTSFEWYKGEFQKQYAFKSEKWKFPKEYYSFVALEGFADFFAFDTARLMWDSMYDEQKSFLDGAIGNSDALWKIAFAHHPYLSNGQHGNAGNYGGLSFVPVASGATVQDFLDDVICGKVDLYPCGHDHNRQSFTASASNCGVHFIVNGASAKVSDLAYHDDNFTLWDDETKPGFVWAEIQGESIQVVWYDLDGNVDFEYTIDK